MNNHWFSQFLYQHSTSTEDVQPGAEDPLVYTAANTPNEVPESPDCTSISRALSLMEDRVVDFHVREPSGYTSTQCTHCVFDYKAGTTQCGTIGDPWNTNKHVSVNFFCSDGIQMGRIALINDEKPYDKAF